MSINWMQDSGMELGIYDRYPPLHLRHEDGQNTLIQKHKSAKLEGNAVCLNIVSGKKQYRYMQICLSLHNDIMKLTPEKHDVLEIIANQ